jgi:hypothetical protein
MFKFFEDARIEDLEAEVNDWLIHSGVRVVRWDMTKNAGHFILAVEYSWMQRQQDDQQ